MCTRTKPSLREYEQYRLFLWRKPKRWLIAELLELTWKVAVLESTRKESTRKRRR